MTNKCINCWSDLIDKSCQLQDTFDFQKSIFTQSGQPGERRGRPKRGEIRAPTGRKRRKTEPLRIQALQALDLIFQISDRQDYANICSAEESLCPTCAQVLGQLFRNYFQFVSASRVPSYLHGILQGIQSLQRNLGKYLRSKEKEPPASGLVTDELQTQNDFAHLERAYSECGSSTQDAEVPISMNPKLVLERLKMEIKVEPLDLVDSNLNVVVDCGFNMDGMDETSNNPQMVPPPPTRKYRKKIPSEVSRKSDRSRKSTPMVNTSSSGSGSRRVKIPCKKCSSVFNDKLRLKMHMGTHADISNSKEICHICSCAFKKHTQLKAHMFRDHPNAPVPWRTTNVGGTFSDFTCHMCKAKFLLANNLNRHFVDKHCYCPICKTDFPTTELVNAHMMDTHGPNWAIPVLVCEFCGYKSLKEKLIKRHKILMHSVAGPISCNVCGKNVDCNNALQLHMRGHNDERPYKCDQCPMTYKHPSNLKEHKLCAHAGVKFICEQCGHASTNAANLRKHVAGVHCGIPQVQKRTPGAVKKRRIRPKDLLHAHKMENAVQGTHTFNTLNSTSMESTIPQNSQATAALGWDLQQQKHE